LGRVEKLFDLATSGANAAAARIGVQFWSQAFDNALLSDAMLADHQESVEHIAALLRSDGDIARTDAKALAELTIAALRGFGLQRAIVPTIDLKPAAAAFLRALRCELAQAKSARRGSRKPAARSRKSRGAIAKKVKRGERS